MLAPALVVSLFTTRLVFTARIPSQQTRLS